jgi:alpha-galactosidase
MPVSTLLIGNQNMLNASKSMNEFTYLSVVSATGILVGDVRKMDNETRTWYKKWNDWFSMMDNMYEFTKYYQIGDVFDYPTNQNWDGCYRFNTEKQGGVLFFYRNASFDSTRIFKVHCVDPTLKYLIYNPDNKKEKWICTGKQLIENGLRITMKNKYSAKVFGIQALQ